MRATVNASIRSIMPINVSRPWRRLDRGIARLAKRLPRPFAANAANPDQRQNIQNAIKNFFAGKTGVLMLCHFVGKARLEPSFTSVELPTDAQPGLSANGLGTGATPSEDGARSLTESKLKDNGRISFADNHRKGIYRAAKRKAPWGQSALSELTVMCWEAPTPLQRGRTH